MVATICVRLKCFLDHTWHFLNIQYDITSKKKLKFEGKKIG